MKYALLALILVFAACSKKNNQPYYAGASTYSSTSCTNMNTANSYTGDFDNGCVSGSLQLSISAANQSNYSTSFISNFSASGLLTMNGKQYCCTTYGGTGSLTRDPSQLVVTTMTFEAAITSLSLRCTSLGNYASDGVYGGAYYNSILEVTMPIAIPPMNYVYMSGNKRIAGTIKIRSNYSSVLPSYGCGYSDPNSQLVFMN